MMFKVVIILLFLSVPVQMTGQTKGQRMTLMFTGDIMCHDEQLKSARENEDSVFRFGECFRYISPVLAEADYTIGNLETTLGGGPYRGYPAFSSPASLAAACFNAGINCLLTANNHITDRGREGVEQTINRLDSLGIPYSGTYLSEEHKDRSGPLLLRKNGITAAILNYTEFTNSRNYNPPPLINYIDTLQIKYDIADAGRFNPDIIIICLHWGREYDTIPGEYQVLIAGSLIRCGADIIIGSHPHVVQRIEWYRNEEKGKDAVVAYSLGNFISNQSRPGTEGGAMLRIMLEKEEGKTSISGLNYCPTWVYKPVSNNTKRFYILPCQAFENDTSFFSSVSQLSRMNSFRKMIQRQLCAGNSDVSEFIPSETYKQKTID